jgi:hypothetical protein
MKKTKKFEDGGPTGGRYVDMGDSQVFVPNTPDAVAAPVAAGIGPVRGGPMSGGIGAGLDGIQDAAGRTETLMPFLNNEPMPISRPIGAGLGGGQDVSRPMGLMTPPNRRIGVRGAVPGTYSSGMAGMKKGGTVKKMAKGGSASSASKRGDGCAIKGKTKGRII